MVVGGVPCESRTLPGNKGKEQLMAVLFLYLLETIDLKVLVNFGRGFLVSNTENTTVNRTGLLMNSRLCGELKGWTTVHRCPKC